MICSRNIVLLSPQKHEYDLLAPDDPSLSRSKRPTVSRCNADLLTSLTAPSSCKGEAGFLSYSIPLRLMESTSPIVS